MSKYTFRSFELCYPNIAKNAAEVVDLENMQLLITMTDGEKFLYDEIGDTLRTLPKDFYMDDDECKREFGLRLQRIMKLKGFNQSSLAEATGINQNMISGYIRGTINPSFTKVDRIAKVLGCSVDEFRYFDK